MTKNDSQSDARLAMNQARADTTKVFWKLIKQAKKLTNGVN